MKKIFLKECFLQKTNRYEALEELSNDKNALDPGTPLCLCFDEDLDKEQKLVFAKKTINDNEGKIIGVLSDEDAKDIKPYLDVEITDLYECRISRYNKDGDENKRFSIAIFIVSKEHVNRQQERPDANPQHNGEGA